MSNAISWDNQHFSLGRWILSLTFFRSKIFICFFIFLSFPKEYGIRGWGEEGGSGGWGLEVSFFWERQPVGTQLTLVQYVCLKKQLNPADAFF